MVTLVWSWFCVEVALRLRWGSVVVTLVWSWFSVEVALRLRWGSVLVTLVWSWGSVVVALYSISYDYNFFNFNFFSISDSQFLISYIS